MGRKIPAKKHRGVKDPIVQQARRLQILKTKINAPPKDPDEQPVPRSLERLFAFQHNTHSGDNRNTHVKRTHNKERVGSVRAQAGDNPISRLRLLPGESARGFSLRINSAVRALHCDVTPQDYPVDMEEEDGRGARMAELREKRARKQRRALGGRLPAKTADIQLTRTQKLALKKKAKKEKLEESGRDGREVQYERVPFGEVAQCPPALRPPRGATGGPAAARPGARALLLSKLLPPSGPAGASPGRGGSGSGPRLRQAEALRLERARTDAIRYYRELNAKKTKNNKQT